MTSDLVSFTDNERINLILNNLVRDVKSFTEGQFALTHRLIQIGEALSAEKNIERLLELIVDEARDFACADGGTMYIMSCDESELHFSIVQNTTLDTRMGGTGGEITWPSIMLKNPDGSPNFANASAYTAISGETVNIPDVYDAEGFNFQGTRKFDADTGYRSKSMLIVPMRNHENDIIGVLQLLNALDPLTGQVISFSYDCQHMTESLASQAAIALTNRHLIHDLENLLESIIASIASAIDEKSPYTGGHVKRVADLTLAIADKIKGTGNGPYADVHFDDVSLKELRIAAWLHDIGKITTPEYVVDKSTKLETIFDRIGTIETRFEVIKRDHEIKTLKNRLMRACADSKDKTHLPETDTVEADSEFLNNLEKDKQFLLTVNLGGEFMAEEKVERVREIAKRTWECDGKQYPLLTENEIYNLIIQRGTLTNEEREIINNHARVTKKMLSQLPFPKKLRNVPLYAGAHHETINGKGYPLGLKGSEIPLQARILALADIFEALTAFDRPYRKGKTLSEALSIMSFMVKDGHIDTDLYDLFIREKIYLDYAQKHLSPEQIDKYD